LSCDLGPSDRNKILELLTQRIAQVPRIPKKVLAMYYYEDSQPAELADGLGLAESEIGLIFTQTVRLLRNKLVADLKQIAIGRPDSLSVSALDRLIFKRDEVGVDLACRYRDALL
jgi:hypothetical protein